LACSHFGPCSGCTLAHGLWSPPVAAEAQQFFAARGLPDFTVQQGGLVFWFSGCNCACRRCWLAAVCRRQTSPAAGGR
jgi:hypothetical protein